MRTPAGIPDWCFRSLSPCIAVQKLQCHGARFVGLQRIQLSGQFQNAVIMRVQGECHDLFARNEKPGFLWLPFVFSTFNLPWFPPFADRIRVQFRKLITKWLRCQISNDLCAGCRRNMQSGAQCQTCCREKLPARDAVWLRDTHGISCETWKGSRQA